MTVTPEALCLERLDDLACQVRGPHDWHEHRTQTTHTTWRRA